MSFAEKLKLVRKERNITQEELAELLDVSRQAVSKWESGMGYPETEKLIVLAKELDISLDYLLLEEDFIAEKKKAAERPIVNTGGKIAIRTYNGQTVVSCHAVKSAPVLSPSENQPKFVLHGIDKVTFWGDHFVTLGWYKEEEDILKEIKEITEAMSRGESTYELRYAAKVIEKWIGFPEIVES